MRKMIIPVAAILASLGYIAWRTMHTTQTVASWSLLVAELLIVTQMLFLLWAKVNNSKSKRTISNTSHESIAFVQYENDDVDGLEKTLFSLSMSNEITKIFVNNADADLLVTLAGRFSKISVEQITEENINAQQVLYINAGDVVFSDTVSKLSAYQSEEIKLVVPTSILWSNNVSSASTVQSFDTPDEQVTRSISKKDGYFYCGETALVSGDVFKRTLEEFRNSDFNIVREQLSASSLKSEYVSSVSIEKSDVNSTATIISRANEIRSSFRSIFKLDITLFTLRYATRPLRATGIVFLWLSTILSVTTNVLPFSSSLASTAFISCILFASLTFAIHKVNRNSSQSSLLRHSMRNLGSDLLAPFTNSLSVKKIVNKYAGAFMCTTLSAALLIGTISDWGSTNTDSKVTATNIFAMTVIAILIYGLEMVSIKQRRSSLRRNVLLNGRIENETIEISDLSPKDCGFVSNKAFSKGDIIKLAFSLPTKFASKELIVNARVVNATSKGITNRAGCVFEDLDRQSIDALTEFCLLTYPQNLLEGKSQIEGSSTATSAKIPSTKNKRQLSFIGNVNTKPLLRVAAIVALLAITLSNLPPYTGAQAATTPGTSGTLAGYVYQDFNLDGKKDAGSGASATDVGIQGVKVLAVCTDGQSKEALSNAAGEFIISGVSGQCRIHVDNTTLPVGMTSAQIGSDSNSLVQFVPAGTANIAFGLGYSNDYCQANPDIITACFGRGSSVIADKGAILKSKWMNENDPAYSDVAKFNSVGTIYGLAYNKSSKTVYG